MREKMALYNIREFQWIFSGIILCGHHLTFQRSRKTSIGSVRWFVIFFCLFHFRIVFSGRIRRELRQWKSLPNHLSMQKDKLH